MRWALLAVLSACNAVYGIEPTGIAPADIDRDGVLDEDDNCIDIANPQQEESDGDALGDACDHCPGVRADSNHDEDRDGRPDACDACPGTEDFVGFDNDSDNVGDACDRDSSKTQRGFESFESLAAWSQAQSWQSFADDTVAPSSRPPANDPGIQFVPVDVRTSHHWYAEVGIEATMKWTAGDRFGITASTASGLTGCYIECGVECTVNLYVDGALQSMEKVTETPRTLMRLDVLLVNPSSGAYDFDCEVPGGVPPYTSKTPASTQWAVGVVASPALRASYLDVLIAQ